MDCRGSSLLQCTGGLFSIAYQDVAPHPHRSDFSAHHSPLAHLSSAPLAALSLLEHTQCASGPLHLLFHLSTIVFPQICK